MRKRGWSAAAAAVTLLVAGGCSEAPDRTSAEPADEVVAVHVAVSGGISGRREAFALRADDVPPGVTRARRARLLDLAGRLASSAGPSAGAPPPCCDVRTVVLRVRYADGTRSRVAVPETELPASLTPLLAMGSDVR